MAAGYHDFVPGEYPTAATIEDYLMLQSVMRFASAAARDTALSAVLTSGLMAYTTDTKRLWVYDGSAWQIILSASRIGAQITWDVSGTRDDVATASSTSLWFGTETYDTDGFSANTQTVTIPTGLGGLYSISGSAAASTASLGTQPQCSITAASMAYTFAVGLNSGRFSAATVMQLAAADTVQFQCYQSSGATIQILSGRFDIWRLGI